MKRVPPSARLKEEIEGLLRGDTTAAPPPDDAPMAGFVRQLARYILQVSIEAEATAFLGRGHYRRGDRVRPGWRNGYEPKHVQSEAGGLALAVPQLRCADDRFQPPAGGRVGTRAPDLEAVVRGCTCAGSRRRMSVPCIARRLGLRSRSSTTGRAPGGSAVSSCLTPVSLRIASTGDGFSIRTARAGSQSWMVPRLLLARRTPGPFNVSVPSLHVGTRCS